MDRKHAHNFEDLTGRRFGKLTVYSPLPHVKNRKTRWECLCDCGEYYAADKPALIKGFRTCCSKCRLIDPQELGIKRMLHTYTFNAKNRNLSFDLEFEDFKFLTQQNCVYCGSEPDIRTTDGTREVKYKANGIDRFDSNLGYNLSNCYTCCRTCNAMKLDHSFQEFKEHIIKLYDKLVAKYE